MAGTIMALTTIGTASRQEAGHPASDSRRRIGPYAEAEAMPATKYGGG